MNKIGLILPPIKSRVIHSKSLEGICFYTCVPEGRIWLKWLGMCYVFSKEPFPRIHLKIFFTFKYSFMSNWLLSTVTPCKNSLWQGSQLQHKPKPYGIIESKTKSKGTFPTPISFLYTPMCSFTWQIIVHLSSDSQTAIIHMFGDFQQRKSLCSEESHLNINKPVPQNVLFQPTFLPWP